MQYREWQENNWIKFLCRFRNRKQVSRKQETKILICVSETRNTFLSSCFWNKEIVFPILVSEQRNSLRSTASKFLSRTSQSRINFIQFFRSWNQEPVVSFLYLGLLQRHLLPLMFYFDPFSELSLPDVSAKLCAKLKFKNISIILGDYCFTCLNGTS